MCVLVELSQQNDTSKIQQLWNLLSDLYSACPTLSDLSEDRRKSHTAGLVIAAWKARQNKPGADLSLPKPEFVTHLGAQLLESRTGHAGKPSAKMVHQESARNRFEPVTPEKFLADQDADFVFDFDFQDIDWSFWSSID